MDLVNRALAPDDEPEVASLQSRLWSLVLAMALLVSACNSAGEYLVTCEIDFEERRDWNWEAAPDEVNGLIRLARVEGDRFLVSTVDGEAEFIVGVNLGATVPGHAPGELEIEREDYRRWFPQMTAMGIRAVRIYTIHPPEFYEELASYNEANPREPLYLVHGAWIPQQDFLETRDLFHPTVREVFRREIADAVGAIHGDTVLPERPGHASGTYTADVSPWLIGWVIGVEWDPKATFESDETNSEEPQFRGTYFESSRGSSPTETWLAEMLDHLAVEEAGRGWTGPVAFANWPTTDPLAHPEEPLEDEDLVGVDANNVRPTAAWPGGYFVNYHAYPYYPDFIRYEPGIADFDYCGSIDPYAGYLAALHRHHDGLPVVISEFGVPSAAGSAHQGPLGRDQGGLSEQMAMAINADLLEIIHNTGMAGAFYFAWTDEWFKRTWNTMDYEVPEHRRPLWQNSWTNEAHFGLLAVEAGEEPIVIVDGDGEEWLENGSQVISESQSLVREVRAVKDESHLYLRLVLDEAFTGSQMLTVGVDVLEGGAGGLPGLPGVDPGADYAVTLQAGQGQMWVRASNDPHSIINGKVLGYFDPDSLALEEGSMVWNRQQLITNRPRTLPTTGEPLGVEVFPVGEMVKGTSDPADPAFDSRTTWASKESVVELRLPYQAIGFSDPSSLQAYRIGADGTVTTEDVARVGITLVIDGQVQDTVGYGWELWQEVEWRERPKAGLSMFTEVVKALNGLSP